VRLHWIVLHKKAVVCHQGLGGSGDVELRCSCSIIALIQAASSKKAGVAHDSRTLAPSNNIETLLRYLYLAGLGSTR
jgi:hypothetical protein